MDSFYVSKYPVTMKEYKKYLDDSGYIPKDTWNFLKNWNISQSNNGENEYMYPNGWDNKPVTYISITEAQNYCNFYNRRLITNAEFEYVGQGDTLRIYPWGNDFNSNNYPPITHGRNLIEPIDVNKYSPQGDSYFGVSSMIGNIWQFTDIFEDKHTRSVITKGSSNYYPSGSQWYFPQAYELNLHNKYFLMDDSYERCGTIGIRCVQDTLQSNPYQPFNFISNGGNGIYCINDKNKLTLASLCGILQPTIGYNNLTQIGTLDWISFGLNNDNDNNLYSVQ